MAEGVDMTMTAGKVKVVKVGDMMMCYHTSSNQRQIEIQSLLNQVGSQLVDRFIIKVVW